MFVCQNRLLTGKRHYVSEDEWTIFENTHEAIIDQQTFDLVQKIRSNVRRYPNGWGEAAPLTGLLYCADCGGKMYVHRTNNGRRISGHAHQQQKDLRPVAGRDEAHHGVFGRRYAAGGRFWYK